MDEDICLATQPDPDACAPSLGDVDICAQDLDTVDQCTPSGDTNDTCPDPGLGGSAGDVCFTLVGDLDYCHDGQDANDSCIPQLGDPDVGPVAVELVSFTATAEGREIRLDWETASEVDNLGFHLYRGDSPDEPQVSLTSVPIPSQAPGSPVGGTYTFLDGDVQLGERYWYWLEDIDFHGVATRHGPIQAELPRFRRSLPPRPRHGPSS
jgi:hypothetical protein